MKNPKLRIAVPYFHSIQPDLDPNWVKNFLTISTELFEKYLIFLKKNGWQTIFLDEMYELRRQQVKSKTKFCCITFDDGYLDNYTHAFPLLQKHGMKGTIFVSPECVDTERPKAAIIPKGKDNFFSTPRTAYLNWEELSEMQASGIMDIQSHTMTHTKYYCSDKIVSFHHPSADSVYQIINKFPELRSKYMRIPDLNNRIPNGTPIFQSKSSVVTRIHEINPEFCNEVVRKINKLDYVEQADFAELFKSIFPLYKRYLESEKLIIHVEELKDYKRRVQYEIAESKAVLEKKLNKPVNFLCWPHGENDVYTHSVAIESGYLATTVGKSGADANDITRFDRIGVGGKYNRYFTKLRWRFKLHSTAKIAPDYQLGLAYRRLRYGKH